MKASVVKSRDLYSFLNRQKPANCIDSIDSKPAISHERSALTSDRSTLNTSLEDFETRPKCGKKTGGKRCKSGRRKAEGSGAEGGTNEEESEGPSSISYEDFLGTQVDEDTADHSPVDCDAESDSEVTMAQTGSTDQSAAVPEKAGIRNYFSKCVKKPPTAARSSGAVALTFNADVHARPAVTKQPVFSIFQQGDRKTGLELSGLLPEPVQDDAEVACAVARQPSSRSRGSNVAVETARLDLRIINADDPSRSTGAKVGAAGEKAGESGKKQPRKKTDDGVKVKRETVEDDRRIVETKVNVCCLISSSDPDSPNVDIDSPNVDLDSPNVDLDSPKVDHDSPNVDLDSPNVDLDSPNADLDSPSIDLDSANVDLDSPKVDLDSPNVDLDSANVGAGQTTQTTQTTLDLTRRRGEKTTNPTENEQTPPPSMTDRRQTAGKRGSQRTDGQGGRRSTSLLQKKRLRTMYRSTIVQKANIFKKTPIKMKLMRIVDVESIAQLKKTKRKNVKLNRSTKLFRNGNVESTNEGDLRRSVRRSSMAAKSAILLCLEEPKLLTRLPKYQTSSPQRQSARVTRLRCHDKTGAAPPVVCKKKQAAEAASKSSKPSAPAADLASIFQPAGRRAAVKPAKTLDDDAKQRRREFLLSSAPVEMKTELRARDDLAASHPSWPPAHVLQFPAAPCWATVEPGPWRVRPSPPPLSEGWSALWPRGAFSSTLHWGQQGDRPRPCHEGAPTDGGGVNNTRSPLSRRVIDGLLAEITSHNPNFPASETYNLLLERKRSSLKGGRHDAGGTTVVSCGASRKRKGAAGAAATPHSKKPRQTAEVTESPLPSGSEEGGGVITVDSDDAPEERGGEGAAASDAQDVQWTDRYAPVTARMVLGHSRALCTLHAWLRRWKQLTEKRAKKELSKTRTRPLDTSLDDFVSGGGDGSSGSEADDDAIGNTMLITGAHGIGKTAMVYALAAQLGYKVFEVNASSRRSGKRVLCDLQEATQSQRVCGGGGGGGNHGDSSANIRSLLTSDKRTPRTDNKKGKKVGKVRGEEVGKVRRDVTEVAAGSSLNLRSTSLILFEEVDVVLDEDKGLWAAIETFIDSTKRPIVLTTSDVTFSGQFVYTLEENIIKAPSSADVTSYLQAVCLAENIRSEFHDVHSLVAFLRADIRRCLLSLQFWAASGGSRRPVDAAIHDERRPTRHSSRRRDDDTTQDGNSNRSTATDTEQSDASCDAKFLSLSNAHRKMARSGDGKRAAGEPATKTGGREETRGDSDEDLTAPLHGNCFSSMTGGSSGDGDLLKLVCDLSDSTRTSELISRYRTIGVHLLYNNMYRILSLATFEPTQDGGMTSAEQTRGDCSDASRDGDQSQRRHTTPAAASGEDSGRLDTSSSQCSLRSLDALSCLQDDLSFADALYNRERRDGDVAPFPRSYVLPGLDDRPIRQHESDWSEYDGLGDIVSAIELFSFRKAREKMEGIRRDERSEAVCEGDLEVVDAPRARLAMTRETSQQIRRRHCVRRAAQNVLDSLQPMTFTKTELCTDYLTSVRAICQSEQQRHLMKVKRRFLHYFDHIQLRLKPSAMQQLSKTIN